MENTTLDELNQLVAACDAHHHFYHYKSSWQHLRLAKALHQKRDVAGARKHYDAAIFQDHLNQPAIAGRAALNEERPLPPVPPYRQHIDSGALDKLTAYELSLGWEADESMEYFASGDFEEGLRIGAGRHDRYHRHASDMHLKRGRYFLEEGEAELAIADFSKALDLHRNNVAALAARMRVYEMKNNETMAAEDRLRLKDLRKPTP